MRIDELLAIRDRIDAGDYCTSAVTDATVDILHEMVTVRAIEVNNER